MNKLKAYISDIEVNGSLSLVTLKVSETCFLRTIIVETPQSVDYLTEGHPIFVMFKETEVVIATGDLSQISLQNRIPGSISQLDIGSLISKVHLQTDVGNIISIISTRAVNQLELHQNAKVTALIKLNEIMLSE